MPDRHRNTSPYEFFRRLAAENKPRHQFSGGDVSSWQQEARPAVLATLGTMPQPVPPNPSLIAEWQENGLIRQRWLLDVAEGLSVIACINRPADTTGRLPAILCWHGHNEAGKEPVMGNSSSPRLRDVITVSGTDYGERMARAGFVTYAIDWMGRGDLDDRAKPNHRDIAGGRDWCNIYYLHATMLGMTPLGINVANGRAVTDFVATLPFVDAGRLGVMGESGGGTMTLWCALVDERLRAVEIICYSDLFADFGYRDLNYCGSQVTPGLFTLVDLPDLQGLLAPRPLLVDIGTYDECFRLESAMACHERLREIYYAAGAADRLQLELGPNGHGWHGGRKSVAFFTENLGDSC